MSKSLTEMAAELVAAQLANRDMSPIEVSDALRDAFSVLTELRDLESMRETQKSGTGEEGPDLSRVQAGHPWPEHPVEPTADKPVPMPGPSGRPAMDPKDSIREDQVICLECGKAFKQLTFMHLRKHGLTPEQYKDKYGLPRGQALAAREVSEARRQRAKGMGLGGGPREGRQL